MLAGTPVASIALLPHSISFNSTQIAYLLTTGAFQLLFGRLYTICPIKWVFITAITVFEIGSLVCAATPSSVGLITGRAIAGLGAAGIFSGALIILSNVVPLRSRPAYMGMIGGVYGIASVAGPLLGGVFTVRWASPS